VSISVLEKFVSGADKTTRMPAVSCIGSVTGDGCSVAHNWDNAIDVDPTELFCQVRYLLQSVLCPCIYSAEFITFITSTILHCFSSIHWYA